MTVLEVHLNGRRRATAGVQESGVVTGIVSLVRRRKSKGYSEELVLGVSGLAAEPKGAKNHVEWFTKKLRAGDEVKIKIRSARAFDAPRQRKDEREAGQ